MREKCSKKNSCSGYSGFLNVQLRSASYRSTTLTVGQNAGRHNLACNNVWVHVGRWPTVLKVSFLLFLCHTRDANRAAAICDAVGELGDRSCLMRASQPPFVVLAPGDVIRCNVLLLFAWGTKPLHCLKDNIIPTRSTHLFGGHVGMATGAVPVTWDGLGIEGDAHSELLANADEQV